MPELKLDAGFVNNGGSIGLGSSRGASGSRPVATLLGRLECEDAALLATMRIGAEQVHTHQAAGK